MAAGTKVADLFAEMSLDLTKYRAGLATAKAEGLSLGSQISNALAGKPLTGNSGIAGLIEDFKLGGKLLPSLKANASGVARDLGSIITTGIGNGLRSVESVGNRVFASLKSVGSSVFKGFLLGAGISGFLAIEQVVERITKAVPYLINKGKDFAETVHALTLETGASAEAASTLLAIYQFFGGTESGLETQLVRLAARVKTNAALFAQYGIAIKDANGETLDQVTIFNNMRDVLSKLPDDAAKVQLIFKVFGQRGAQAIEPLLHALGITDQQYTDLVAHITAQGLVLTDSQIKTADSVERAQADIGNAITGIGVKLFSILGPQVTAFFDSLSADITANAKQITDTFASISNTVIGFVKGLLGIAPAMDTFSTQFTRLDQGGASTSEALDQMQTDLAALKAKLSPARDASAAFNASIEAGVKALDAQGASIDRQITAVNHLAQVELDAYKKTNAVLQARIDLETEALDAEDRQISRSETAATNLRDQAQAYIDLRNAQAQFNKDSADPTITGESRQQTLDKDTVAIADAAQKVRDIQQNISDETRHNAEEDRKVQIANLKAYVSDVEKIVTDSENKKAALTTLAKRKAVLEDEIAKAKASGNAQEAADLAVKLGAVEAGITEENRKIKTGAAVDELTARKKQLDDEKAALQAERTSEADINATATRAAIANKEKEIAAEKKRIAQEKQDKQDSEAWAIERGVIFTQQMGEGGVVPNAFAASQAAGIAFANEVKKAVGGLMDLLFGENLAGPAVGGGTVGRHGGLLGGLGGIVGAFGDIAGAAGKITDAFNGFPIPTNLLIAAGAVVALSGNLPLAALLFAAAGISVGLAAAARVSDNAFKPGGVLHDYGPGGQLGTGQPVQLSGSEEATRAQGIIAALTALHDPSGAYYNNPARIAAGLVPQTNAQTIARLTAELAKHSFSNRGFAQGLSYVPQDMPVFVHQGEGILTAAANLNRGASGGGGERWALVKATEGELLEWINRGLNRKARK